MARYIFDSDDKIAETLLFALRLRADEARRPDPLLHDAYAIALVDQIDYDFSRFKVNPFDQAAAILRVREFDRLTKDFLARNPQASVIHIGCGLDTRFTRVDNGQVQWFDLDLPEVINLRQQLIPSTGRSTLIGCSVFDSDWTERIGAHARQGCLFLAEGVFPYFTQDQVKSLFLQWAKKFPGCELVCDGMSSFMVRLHNLELVASRVGARLHWGLKNGREPEAWDPSIHLISEWFYFDRPEPRIRAYMWMRHLPLFAKGVGIFHYRLGERPA